MNYEESRRKSFDNGTLQTHLNPVMLARKGFHYGKEISIIRWYWKKTPLTRTTQRMI